ncbi:uncharacterized protein B0H18DRAFT_1122524 [Fomitopsis serialis]|uniref:uncharacterized protein n=1 Tax=Fomitopsis serialis TaxID=139415 RepID=UPI002007BA06|nr:uncharacterized protein B0H18DRAFT_1122524 [Neoantrodia serialis]KAH9919405.1 hypothetical protein B0H18DRAFT_1122524 [Neoantrodia serialis]
MSHPCGYAPQDEPPSATLVTPAFLPFDRADADLILRTADNVEFRVHKLTMRMASEIFEEMFRLGYAAAPSEDDAYGIPVVRVTEHSSIIDPLLRIIYPIQDPVLDVPTTACEVMRASLKYEMEVAMTFAQRVLMDPKVAAKDPLAVYAAACQMRMPSLALEAAKLSLRHDRIFLAVAAPVGLDSLPATILFALMQYREKCKAVVQRFVQDDRVWKSWSGFRHFLCGICDPRPSTTTGRRVKAPMPGPVPDMGEVLLSSMLLMAGSREITKCVSCRMSIVRDVRELHAEILAEIQRSVAMIKLDLVL